jgi:protein-S-isoprenylcysteine O-methyltransferase Ste14
MATEFKLYRWAFKTRGLLMAPLVLCMFVCRLHEAEQDWLIFPLGGAIFCAGLLIRLWSQTHLRHRLKVKTELTTTGPYRYMRNPLYVGNTLLLVGLCVMMELLWMVPIVLVYCAIVYTLVVRDEERRLVGEYGVRYDEYRRQVPRWMPRGLPKAAVLGSPAIAFLGASIKAEAHNLLWLILPVVKELTPLR